MYYIKVRSFALATCTYSDHLTAPNLPLLKYYRLSGDIMIMFTQPLKFGPSKLFCTAIKFTNNLGSQLQVI